MDEETERLSDILKDVNPEKSFWINKGPTVRNIYELVAVLHNIEDKTFSFHVNKDRNDLSEWVKTVLKDDQLAEDLLKTTKKNETIRKIKKRISYIEDKIDKEKKKEMKTNKETPKKGAGKELSMEKMFLELIISFILGTLVGIAIGILIEHYALIPRGWF